MQNKRLTSISLLFCLFFAVSGIAKESIEHAKRAVREGFKAPSYDTSFASERLFSIADVKSKTYIVKSPQALRLTRGATYEPNSETYGSPMIWARSSTVVIDFNGQVITKEGNTRCVGIEVGYSPGNIGANTQVQNVILKNGVIDNFDVGLMVHAGVKSVRLENMTFARCPVGAILLGESDNLVTSCSLENVRFIGTAQMPKSVALVTALTWVKAKVETAAGAYASGALEDPASDVPDVARTTAAHDGGMGYSADDLYAETTPFDGSTAYVAGGLIARYNNNLLLDNVLSVGHGYVDGADSNVIVQSLKISDSDNIFLQNVQSSNNASSMVTNGCRMHNCTSVSIQNSVFSNNLAQVQGGVNTASNRHASGLRLSTVNAVLLAGVTCNNNIADSLADLLGPTKAEGFGIHIDTGNAIEIKETECNYNSGMNTSSGGTGVGLYANNVSSVDVAKLLANYNVGYSIAKGVHFDGANYTLNLADIEANSNASAGGIVSGVHVDTGQAVQLRNVSANYNNGAGAVNGLFFESSIKSCEIDGASLVSNTSSGADVKACNVESAESFEVRNAVASYNTSSSGSVYGFSFGSSAENVVLENVMANNNEATSGAVQALGVAQGDTVSVRNMEANNNTATATTSVVQFTTSAKSVSMDNVRIHANSVSASNAITGLALTALVDGSFKDLSVSNNTSAGGAVIGVDFLTSANSVTMKGAQINANSSTTNSVHGLKVTNGKNIHLYDASVSENKQTGTGTAAVIGIEAASGVESFEMRNVEVNNTAATGTGTAHGIKCTDAKAVSAQNLEVNNTQSAVAAVGLEFLLSSNSSTDSLYFDGLVCNNTTSTGAAAKGFVVHAGENIKVLHGSCSHTVSEGAACHGMHFVTSAKSVEMDDVVLHGNSAGTSGAVYGMQMVAGDNVTLKNLAANQNSGTGVVYGVEFATSVKTVDMQNCAMNSNNSSGGAVAGLRGTDAVSVSLKDVSADYNRSTSGAVAGIEFLGSSGNSSFTLENISANNNQATDGNLSGVKLQKMQALSIDGLQASYNVAAGSGNVVRGLFVHRTVNADYGVMTGHMKNIVCDNNASSDASSGTVFGCEIQRGLAVQINNISCSKNSAAQKAYGLYFENAVSADGASANLYVTDGVCNGNAATQADVTAADVVTNVNMSKHMPSQDGRASLEGAFGVYAYDSDSIDLERVEASYNNGARAGGIFFENCHNCSLHNCKTSYQQADGQFYVDTPFAAFTAGDGTLIEFPVHANHVNLIYGGTDQSGVDIAALTEDYLEALRQIKFLQDNHDLDVRDPDHYAYLKKLSSGQALLNAALAQYRRFSTAVGLQLHDCSNCLVVDHAAVANASQKDSGIGIGMSGTANGHLVLRAKASGNEAWSDSAVASNGSIDLSAQQLFWELLETEVLDGDASDTLTSGNDFNTAITSTQIANAPATEPTPVIATDRLAIKFNTDNAVSPNYTGFLEMGPAAAPEAAGIVVADAADNIEVTACDCANNKAHAGKAYGLLQDSSISLLAKDNRFFQNEANDFGTCFGVSELTLQSNSIHVGNVMFSNMVGNYLNSNFFVPYDPEDYPMIYYPVKVGYNGDLGNFANASPFDNLVVEFVEAKQTSRYMPNNMLTFWDDAADKNDWIVDA